MDISRRKFFRLVPAAGAAALAAPFAAEATTRKPGSHYIEAARKSVKRIRLTPEEVRQKRDEFLKALWLDHDWESITVRTVEEGGHGLLHYFYRF